VTRVVGATTGTTASPTPTPSTQAPGGSFGRRGGGGFFGGPGSTLNAADLQALQAENNNVVTDLSKLGKPGTKFTHDFFVSATLLSFPQDALTQIASIRGVAAATGALTQLANHQTGTVPQIVAEIKAGGQNLTQTVRPPPLTAAQRKKIQACFEKRFAGGVGGRGGPG